MVEEKMKNWLRFFPYVKLLKVTFNVAIIVAIQSLNTILFYFSDFKNSFKSFEVTTLELLDSSKKFHF